MGIETTYLAPSSSHMNVLLVVENSHAGGLAESLLLTYRDEEITLMQGTVPRDEILEIDTDKPIPLKFYDAGFSTESKYTISGENNSI